MPTVRTSLQVSTLKIGLLTDLLIHFQDGGLICYTQAGLKPRVLLPQAFE